MQNKRGFLSYSHIDKIVFGLSIFVSLFWFLGQYINVYNIALVGAVFELLSVPMLILLIALPVLSTLLLVNKGVSVKSLPLYSILLLAATFLVIAF